MELIFKYLFKNLKNKGNLGIFYKELKRRRSTVQYLARSPWKEKTREHFRGLIIYKDYKVSFLCCTFLEMRILLYNFPGICWNRFPSLLFYSSLLCNSKRRILVKFSSKRWPQEVFSGNGDSQGIYCRRITYSLLPACSLHIQKPNSWT
jgi:hypothetical protein